jgi:hypothetical protein
MSVQSGEKQRPYYLDANLTLRLRVSATLR